MSGLLSTMGFLVSMVVDSGAWSLERIVSGVGCFGMGVFCL